MEWENGKKVKYENDYISENWATVLALLSFIFPFIFVFYLFKAIIKYARS